MRTAGLFDLQVNGFAGVDFNDTALTADALDHALMAMLATGVTQCLPTLITASRDTLQARFATLDAAVAKSRLGHLMVPGYHLEGPFVNPAPGFRGCHPAHDMIAPDIALVDQLRKALRFPIALVTIAPELDGSEAFITAAHSQGIAIALGHSDARVAAVSRAAAAGASLSTHLGNGVAHQGHKFDNPIFAQLADDALVACFIADGIHVPVHALKVMLRAKGISRSILVTDAVAGAAAPPGLYPFAGMTVERGADGAVREPGAPHLAGSALTLDQAVRNIVNWDLASFDDAVAMASTHPRTVLTRIGNSPINMANTGNVVWSAEHSVQEVTLADKIMYRLEK